MADKINEIISPEAFAQLQELRGELDESAKSLKELAKAAQNLDFSKVKSLSELGQWAQNYEKTVDAMAAANNNYSESAKKVEAAKQRQIRAIEIAEAKEMTAIQRTIAEQEKKAQREEALANKRAQLAQKAAAEAEKAAKREEKALKDLNNEYETLKKSYNTAAAAAKQLGIAAENAAQKFGANSAEAKNLSSQYLAATASAKKMYDSLLKVEMAVGQGQRAVGQYSLAAEGLKQTIREMPAFANSFQTGLMAISNNLPTLLDGIKQLNQKNKEIVASGGKAVSVWDTMKEELKDFGTIAVIGVTVLTLIANKWDKITGAFTKAKDAQDKLDAQTKQYNQSLKEINLSMQENIAKETSASIQMMKTAANVKLSHEQRVDAIKKLRNANEGLFADLKDEYFLAGKTADAEERLNKAIYQKYLAESYGEKAAMAMKKKIQLTTESYDDAGMLQLAPIAKAAEEVKKAERNLERVKKLNEEEKKGEKFYQDIDPTEGLVALEQKVIDAKKAYELLNEELAKSQTQINKFSQKQQEALDELMGLKPGGTNDDKKQKAKKAKKESKDTTLKSESDLLQAIYDNKQKELEITRDTNKAIADDTTKEMADRLVAHENYLAAVLELAKNERDRTIDLEGEKLDEIDRLKQKAKGKELANLIEQQRAAMIRVNTAQMEFNGKQKEVVEKGQKEVIDIVASSNNEWAKDEEKKNEKLKEMQLQAYLVEEELLRRALEGKEITRKEYNTRLKDLQKKQNIAFLQNEVELYDKLLANEQLADDKREEYRKKRNAAQKSLINAQQGVGTGKKKTGRITDGFAKLFIPEGLENEEEYLQQFYDRSVQMANVAADAIISAHQRQYEAQQAMLDAQMAKVQSSYEMQLNLINLTSKSDEEKANKVAKLNSQREEQEAAIQEKKKQAAIRQAKFEKAATVASIIGNTAAAIMKVVKQLGVASPPLVALVAATGAVQLASALAAPIPAYKEGTDNHIGGAFIAGDGGEPELIVAPNKRPYWSNSVSTLYNEGAGTKVIPMSDIMQYTTTNTEDFSAAQLDALANRIAKSFDKTGYKIAQVMQATKPQINMDAIAQQMRRERNLQGK